MINKHNQLLLNKLVEISTGKNIGVMPAPKRLREMNRANGGHSAVRGSSVVKLASPPVSSRHRGSSVGPKQSLNYLVRRKENERIEKENHRFAKRLYESKSILQKGEFEDMHWMQERYKRQLQKVSPSGPRFLGDVSIMSKTGKLPPLDNNITRDSNNFENGLNTESPMDDHRHSLPN